MIPFLLVLLLNVFTSVNNCFLLFAWYLCLITNSSLHFLIKVKMNVFKCSVSCFFGDLKCSVLLLQVSSLSLAYSCYWDFSLHHYLEIFFPHAFLLCWISYFWGSYIYLSLDVCLILVEQNPHEWPEKGE